MIEIGTNVTYKSIKVNGVDVTLSDSDKPSRVSFIAPYNKIEITFRPNAGKSIDRFRALVNKATDDYDLDAGVLAVYRTNIPANTDTKVEVDVNGANFKFGDLTYRIDLYTHDTVSDRWDITYLFCDINSTKVKPQVADGLEVGTDLNLG